MMLDNNRRDEAIEVGYKAMLESPELVDRVNFSLNEFKAVCDSKGAEVWGFFDKEPAGMCVLDGNHPHIVILKKSHGKCGAQIKTLLGLFLKKHRNLVADVHKDNKRAISFVEKLGFRFSSTNGEMLIYILGDDHVF